MYDYTFIYLHEKDNLYREKTRINKIRTFQKEEHYKVRVQH